LTSEDLEPRRRKYPDSDPRPLEILDNRHRRAPSAGRLTDGFDRASVRFL